MMCGPSRIVQPDMEVMRTMAKLEIDEVEEHNDPSDHVIIAQAITMRLPLRAQWCLTPLRPGL